MRKVSADLGIKRYGFSVPRPRIIQADVRDSRELSGGNGWLHTRQPDPVSARHVENSDVCSVPKFPEG